MSHFVYILESLADQSYYIGNTRVIENRLRKHNHCSNGYSSRKSPWKLVYSEEFQGKKDAIVRERFIKQQKSREFILRLLAENF